MATGQGATEGAPQVPTYRYLVDRANRIVHVDDAWLRFAVENGAPELTRERVVGATLFDFFANLTTHLVYEAILERVRQGQMRVSIPFRCDAPGVRRFMELEMVPAAQDGVWFYGRLLRREERPAVPLLDSARPRSNAVIVFCSWCKRVEVTEQVWLEVEEAVGRLALFEKPHLPMVSHGICPTCNENFCSGLKALAP